MSLLADFFVSVILVAFILWWLIYNKKDRIFITNIPSPPAIPFLGHALYLSDSSKMLNVLMDYMKNYGEVLNIQIGPFRNLVVLHSHESLEAVMGSQKFLHKSYDYNFLKPWLGKGLLLSEGQLWKTRRRLLTPAFHFNILEQFIDIFESNGQTMVEIMEKRIGEKNLDIYPLVNLCTLDIICETAMGTHINAQLGQNIEYVKSVKEMCRILVERSVSPLEMYDFLYPFTKNYRIQKKCLKVLHDYTNGVINMRREELKKQENRDSGNNDNEFGMKRRKAFLDLLLEANIDGKPLKHDEIREEVDTFMFEGHDTTSSGIGFALYTLAHYPEIQDKVYQEQEEIFSSNKNPTVTHSNLQDMKYLERVIKEVLRLYPSVPLYGRELTEDLRLEEQNAIIPQGTDVLFSAYGIQRNPRYFKNPNDFNPDRFLEEVDGKLPYAYVPFSAGPRNCIGQKFAMLEMKSTISKVVRRFELCPSSSNHEPVLASETILKSLNGLEVQLKKRT